MIQKETKGFFNLKYFFKSFGHASRGVWWALKYNQNLRFDFAAAITVIILSVIFKINAFEMGVLGVMILVVISAEMINTVVEEVVDLLVTEYREQAKIAKDVAAGMVLVSAIGSLIVGFLVFAPHIFKLVFR